MKREESGSNIGAIFDFEGDAPTEEVINQYSKSESAFLSKAITILDIKGWVLIFMILGVFFGGSAYDFSLEKHSGQFLVLLFFAFLIPFILLVIIYGYYSNKLLGFKAELILLRQNLSKIDIDNISVEGASKILSSEKASRYLHQILSQPRLPTHYEVEMLKSNAWRSELIEKVKAKSSLTDVLDKKL